MIFFEETKRRNFGLKLIFLDKLKKKNIVSKIGIKFKIIINGCSKYEKNIEKEKEPIE